MTGFDILQDIRAHIAKVLRARSVRPETYKLTERKVPVLARWLADNGHTRSIDEAENKLRAGRVKIKGVRILVGA